MDKVICSLETYRKLDATDILSRARKSVDGLETVFLYKSISGGKPEEILKSIKGSKGKEMEEDRADILELERKLEEESWVTWINPFVIEHPFLIGRMVFGSDLEKFAQFGFSSKRDLAKAITVYCASERYGINNTYCKYIWRTRNYRNEISLCDHGDFSVEQIDISSQQNTVILTNPPEEGFGIVQDWSPFLVYALKYAEAIGRKDIPEIINWRDFAGKIRASNPWGSKIPDKSAELDLATENLFLRGLIPIQHPLFTGGNSVVAPSINEDRLEILQENNSGDISIFNGKIKMKRIITYFPEDIPHLLNANYKLFARSVNAMVQIMDYFNSKSSTITD